MNKYFIHISIFIFSIKLCCCLEEVTRRLDISKLLFGAELHVCLSNFDMMAICGFDLEPLRVKFP